MDHRKAKKRIWRTLYYIMHTLKVFQVIYTYTYIYICKEFNDLWQNPCYVRG